MRSPILRYGAYAPTQDEEFGVLARDEGIKRSAKPDVAPLGMNSERDVAFSPKPNRWGALLFYKQPTFENHTPHASAFAQTARLLSGFPLGKPDPLKGGVVLALSSVTSNSHELPKWPLRRETHPPPRSIRCGSGGSCSGLPLRESRVSNPISPFAGPGRNRAG